MSKIIAFPKTPVARPIPCPAPVVVPTPALRAASTAQKPGKPLHRRLVCGAWMLAVLVWPILRWVLALDVAIQFFRAVAYWHVPGRHDGLVLLIHFGVLTAMTLYVSTRPKDFEA